MAIAGLVLRQAHAADEFFPDGGERGLRDNAALAIQHLVRHAILLKHGDIAAGMVELRLLAEQL